MAVEFHLPAFLYGLLPDHLLLALILLLMVMETLRMDSRWARPLVLLAVLGAMAALLHQLTQGYSAEVVRGELHIDRLAILGKLVLLGCVAGLALVFAAPHGASDAQALRNPPVFKFWMLVASSALGGLLMLGSASFATLFIGIELLSLPVFALIVQGQGHSTASEASFKYLVLSSLASALLLFGISLAYGASGTLSLAAFAQALPDGGVPNQAAALLVLSGLFLKAAVFPFHAWAPDAYAGARLGVTALMASLVKAAVVLALARIVADLPLDSQTAMLVGLLGLASIYFGNGVALGQLHFKRLLAYSSVAHAGYMIFALLDTTGSRSSDLLWYSAFYAGATLLACAAFDRLSPEGDDRLQALDGQFARHPLAALVLAAAVLSLAGMPPFPGFFAKLFVFKSVVDSGHLLGAILAFVGSFLGLAYYLGMVLRLFRAPAAAGVAPAT